MAEKHQEAVLALQELQDPQQRQLELQLHHVKMTHFVEIPRLTQFSTLAMEQLTLSETTNITNSLRTQLLKVIRSQSQKVGQDFQATSMLPLPIRMERRTSSRDQSTGGTMDEISTENTQKKSMKVSPECLTTSTPQWSGVEMERFTSTKEVNSGDSTHLKDHQSSQHILNQSAIGKVFQKTSTLPFNTPMDTLTSSRATNITDSTTERSR